MTHGVAGRVRRLVALLLCSCGRSICATVLAFAVLYGTKLQLTPHERRSSERQPDIKNTNTTTAFHRCCVQAEEKLFYAVRHFTSAVACILPPLAAKDASVVICFGPI